MDETFLFVSAPYASFVMLSYLNKLVSGIRVTFVVKHQMAELFDISIYKYYLMDKPVSKTRVFC
jgi:hypothetical protein